MNIELTEDEAEILLEICTRAELVGRMNLLYSPYQSLSEERLLKIKSIINKLNQKIEKEK